MAPSIYEDLRAGDHGMSDPGDIEERAAMAIDEENLSTRYQDYELHEDLFDGHESRMTTESTAFLAQQVKKKPHKSPGRDRRSKGGTKAKWLSRSPRMLDDDGDDDVPASLLIEEEEEGGGPSAQQHSPRPAKAAPITGTATQNAQARWAAVQEQQRLHDDIGTARPKAAVPKPGVFSASRKERAMWMWINVTNLDRFMGEIYAYYRGAGIWPICLDRLLNLLRIVFVATFTTFLTQCVDYSKIRHSTSMSQIVVPQCTKNMSGMPNFAIWLLVLYLIYQSILDIVDISRLRRMQDFYLYLLEIPESDMQTISWQEIVARLMNLRDSNPILADKVSPALRHFMGTQSKQRLDAHDIANRLMRKENYLIALFNKEILDLTLPIPFFRNRQLFSRTIQWNLNFCILDFIFTPEGQIQQMVLKDSKRRQLSDALRNRFLFAGLMNIICAPVIVLYTLIVYFFQYFNEYHKNPAALGSRQYTPLAEWKFREFNELPHLFDNRVNMSYPFASRYVEQFPKIMTVQIARFVAFVAGGIVSILALASIIDPELFLGFEITPDRTVLFYLGVMGTLWAVAHGAVPPDNQVFDPEYALRNVIDYTHYMPKQWKDRLHTDEVKREFAELYQMKIVIFLEEVLSIIFTPLVLWFTLPKCSDRIIDFFREFTVHVDGLGYVCSFAVFDFKKGVGGSAVPPGAGNAAEGLRDEYYSTKHGKMAASYYGFLDNYATNPKTGIPGHVPPGIKHQFHPPPSFPGLMSPSLTADMQTSRLGHQQQQHKSRSAGAGLIPSRTPRFPSTPAAAHVSPMPSMLLDPHHQPSSTGFGGGGKSFHGGPSGRWRGQRPRSIIEQPLEDGEESEVRAPVPSLPNESSGLDASVWETSPARSGIGAAEGGDAGDGEGEVGGGGVLGLLYQFQKAQTDTRPGVNI
ncbi:hypothetical protein VE02_07185 [Pseudogymnoascus sp. 03VT05]|nr:hypothetical protein VE02_07185 [Pseudogymnoascus sp. 03VT05]